MEYSDLYKLFSPPYIYLILGVISFSLGLVWTCCGRARTWGHIWVYHVHGHEPKRFGWEVIMYYLVGAGLISLFFIAA